MYLNYFDKNYRDLNCGKKSTETRCALSVLSVVPTNLLHFPHY